MSIQRIAGYIASAILFFFGVLYALASVYENTRLVVSIIMFMVAFGILFFLYRHKPQELVQRLEVPGKFQTQDIRCTNCSASIDIDKIKLIGLKNSTGGADPDRSSPIVGARKNNTKDGEIFN